MKTGIFGRLAMLERSFEEIERRRLLLIRLVERVKAGEITQEQARAEYEASA
jgi:hypothetical protein